MRQRRHRLGPLGHLLSRWLGPATELMLDMSRVSQGGRVLDVAAGAGEQTMAATRRVGPGGRVLATDLSPNILALAAVNARRGGYGNVDTLVVDGELLDQVQVDSFDAVISRACPQASRTMPGRRSRVPWVRSSGTANLKAPAKCSSAPPANSTRG